MQERPNFSTDEGKKPSNPETHFLPKEDIKKNEEELNFQEDPASSKDSEPNPQKASTPYKEER